MEGFSPVTLVVSLALLAILPMLAVATTSFVKIAVVMSLIRNALGVQQVPPNLVIYGFSLLLSVYVMAPVGAKILKNMEQVEYTTGDLRSMLSAVQVSSEPLRDFLYRNSRLELRDFFLRTAQRLWADDLGSDLGYKNYLVLAPAFLVTELSAAFQLGFLVYLPFVVIDVIVSNILLAMGMMMVSPVTISLPLKLFLFVLVDGWTRMIQGLVLSYL